MIRILFVCLGNICRSPMAEFVFKDMTKKNGLETKFYIDSAATSYEEVGNDMHYGTIDKLEQKGIPYSKHKARRITKEDYNKFDYIIGMEDRNIRDIIRIVGKDTENKVYKLLDFSKNSKDIADPYYTGNFEMTYNDIVKGCKSLLKKIESEEKSIWVPR